MEAFTKTIGGLSCVFVVCMGSFEKNIDGFFGLDDDRVTRGVSSDS